MTAELGAVIPHGVLGTDPGAARAFAVGAEELGYTHLLAYEHVLGAAVGDGLRSGWTGPYTTEDPFHEPFVLYAFMAAATRTIGFVTGVMVLPQRQTALVAKQAAELAILSGGRFRLGVGIGWNEVEYTSLGIPFARRAARYDEQLDLLRRLWADPVVSYHGEFETVPHAGINPLPPGGVPLWLGTAGAPRALDRVARVADGWIPGMRLAADAAEALDRLRTARAATGRPPLGVQARLIAADLSRDAWAKAVHDWADAGATHVAVSGLRMGLTTVDEQLRFLADVAADI